MSVFINLKKSIYNKITLIYYTFVLARVENVYVQDINHNPASKHCSVSHLVLFSIGTCRNLPVRVYRYPGRTLLEFFKIHSPLSNI